MLRCKYLDIIGLNLHGTRLSRELGRICQWSQNMSLVLEAEKKNKKFKFARVEYSIVEEKIQNSTVYNIFLYKIHNYLSEANFG